MNLMETVKDTAVGLALMASVLLVVVGLVWVGSLIPEHVAMWLAVAPGAAAFVLLLLMAANGLGQALRNDYRKRNG